MARIDYVSNYLEAISQRTSWSSADLEAIKAEISEQIRAAKEDAWDEGYQEALLPDDHIRDNPYRKES